MRFLSGNIDAYVIFFLFAKQSSGMVVNEEKTEICLFYKRDHETVNVSIDNKIVTSKKSINVLGVLFDCKLQWNNQVAQAIVKAKRALHGIKLIRKFVNKDQVLI